MNAITRIRPFNANLAYQNERAHSERMERLLVRSNALLRMACDSGKVADPEAVRAFLQECGQ